MVEGKPIGIGNVAYVMGMSSKRLHRWYKEVLSGFVEAERSGELDKHNITVREKGDVYEIKVPIFEEGNLGENMAIDEKNLSGNLYTVLSNRDTGKIAMMASTIKTAYLVKIAKGFDINKRMKVKSLSRDMANHYEWFGKQVFMNAYHIADKFHVIKSILQQLQSSRIYYRQLELTKRRLAKENKETYQETIFENGDTSLQLLARSKGLLFLFPGQWTEQQKARAIVLFDKFPQIKNIYYKVIKIRKWYKAPNSKTTYEKTRIKKKVEINKIIEELNKSGINELLNIANTLSNNLQYILHYFIAKETNAKAEALNQNLQRFIITNYGARNIKFFMFRIKIYFS